MTNHNDSETSSSRKCVSFGVIRVREHERILLDGPDDNVYACLAIGWGHHQSSHRCLVDDLEEPRTPQCPSQRHSASERVQVLNEYGFPLHEVMRNEMMKKKKSSTLTRRRRVCQSAAPQLPSSRQRGGVRRLFLGWGSRKKIF
jgi:hypothetical protein